MARHFRCAFDFKSGKYETRVMAVFCGVEIFLSATLLGLYFFGEKIGSSPFALLRDAMEGAPIFKQANYLSFIKMETD